MMMTIKRDVELYADKENHLFPLFEESDVINAIKFFGLAQNKRDVANAINNRANELGMKIEANKMSDFRRFCAKDILVGDDFAKKTCVSADEMNNLLIVKEEVSERIEKFEKNYFKYRKGYNYINGLINSDALFYFCIMMDLYDKIKYGDDDELVIDAFRKATYLFGRTETTINVKKIIPLLFQSLNIKPEPINEDDINDTTFDSLISRKMKRTVKCVTKECEKMKDELELKRKYSDTTPTSISGNDEERIMILDLTSKITSIIENNPRFLICGGVPCKIELSDASLLKYKRLVNSKQFTGNFHTKTASYNNGEFKETKLRFLMRDSQVILVTTDMNDNLYLIYLDANNLEKPLKVTKVNISVPETTNLSESFQIDEDGSVKIELTKRTNLMDEYDSNHKRIKEAYNNNNLEEVKLLLAYDFALLDRIEHDLNNRKLKEAKRKELIKAKQFLMNDFKTYLRLVTKKEPRFNFTEYYNSCDEIKKFFIVDKKTINGIKTLLRNILL